MNGETRPSQTPWPMEQQAEDSKERMTRRVCLKVWMRVTHPVAPKMLWTATPAQHLPVLARPKATRPAQEQKVRLLPPLAEGEQAADSGPAELAASIGRRMSDPSSQESSAPPAQAAQSDPATTMYDSTQNPQAAAAPLAEPAEHCSRQSASEADRDLPLTQKAH